MNLTKLKKYIAQKHGRGVHSIRLDASHVKELSSKGPFTREKMKEILSSSKKYYKVLPKKRRTYKIAYGKIQRNKLREKNRVVFKRIDLAARLKNKTISDKARWIYHVRMARAYLRDRKAELGSRYRLLYRRVKGGLYLKKFSDLEKDCYER